MLEDVRRQRPIKELKRRTKVEALEKLVYLVLVQEKERLLGRRLRGQALPKASPVAASLGAPAMPKVNI